MTQTARSLTFKSPEETAVFARQLGTSLRPGDVVLLEGPIGSGKTHFARNLIQSLMDEPEDVPSPTFTLVQAYDTPSGEIWHCDLYRLSAAEEVDELGLTDAFDTAICLVEWPDKMGPLAPQGALTLAFETGPNNIDFRRVTLSWTAPKWAEKLERTA
ncbi:tRNA (adenosine(37)-N6)-threonylcarbamoyltransferase complex ATPase subunit type 1 TsaE [Ruegeria sp. HKCCA0235A]|uniref:tRNA (adenosine(37)-N6)-threonylcarbamoyltransferase complex ATPase subunit type 1 TsaE n=1 Tax=Ruegeria sp. HKCCA0235A TaxID=2682998 RepID=UPI0014879ABA|nr:tRNA (adenosine(37)-N6)-threonylcarbamoyltransferase complex ATPase subunit type 1 TsaE [Ruegeria sp. HKCCA0235A]